MSTLTAKGQEVNKVQLLNGRPQRGLLTSCWPEVDHVARLTAMESGKLNGLTDGTAAAYSKIKVLLVWKKGIINRSVGHKSVKAKNTNIFPTLIPPSHQQCFSLSTDSQW